MTELDSVDKNPIRVFLRVRPVKNNQKGENFLEYSATDKQLVADKKTYEFTKVFVNKVSQKEFYENVAKPIIDAVISGKDGLIMAYGASCSGKTYSVTGPQTPYRASVAPHDGLLYRALTDIFDKSPGDYSCTAFEIYQGQVIDLLKSGGQAEKLEIREDGVNGLTENTVQDDHSARCVFHAAAERRQKFDTQLNPSSSRSHAFYCLRHKVNQDQRLCVVDLAGSERYQMNSSVKQQQEGIKINEALTVLRRCIQAIRDNVQGKKTVIPVRDSPVTNALKRYLLNWRNPTCFILCLNPVEKNDSLRGLEIGSLQYKVAMQTTSTSHEKRISKSSYNQGVTTPSRPYPSRNTFTPRTPPGMSPGMSSIQSLTPKHSSRRGRAYRSPMTPPEPSLRSPMTPSLRVSSSNGAVNSFRTPNEDSQTNNVDPSSIPEQDEGQLSVASSQEFEDREQEEMDVGECCREIARIFTAKLHKEYQKRKGREIADLQTEAMAKSKARDEQIVALKEQISIEGEYHEKMELLKKSEERLASVRQKLKSEERLAIESDSFEKNHAMARSRFEAEKRKWEEERCHMDAERCQWEEEKGQWEEERAKTNAEFRENEDRKREIEESKKRWDADNELWSEQHDLAEEQRRELNGEIQLLNQDIDEKEAAWRRREEEYGEKKKKWEARQRAWEATEEEYRETERQRERKKCEWDEIQAGWKEEKKAMEETRKEWKGQLEWFVGHQRDWEETIKELEKEAKKQKSRGSSTSSGGTPYGKENKGRNLELTKTVEALRKALEDERIQGKQMEEKMEMLEKERQDMRLKLEQKECIETTKKKIEALEREKKEMKVENEKMLEKLRKDNEESVREAQRTIDGLKKKCDEEEAQFLEKQKQWDEDRSSFEKKVQDLEARMRENEEKMKNEKCGQKQKKLSSSASSLEAQDRKELEKERKELEKERKELENERKGLEEGRRSLEQERDFQRETIERETRYHEEWKLSMTREREQAEEQYKQLSLEHENLDGEYNELLINFDLIRANFERTIEESERRLVEEEDITQRVQQHKEAAEQEAKRIKDWIAEERERAEARWKRDEDAHKEEAERARRRWEQELEDLKMRKRQQEDKIDELKHEWREQTGRWEERNRGASDNKNRDNNNNGGQNIPSCQHQVEACKSHFEVMNLSQEIIKRGEEKQLLMTNIQSLRLELREVQLEHSQQRMVIEQEIGALVQEKQRLEAQCNELIQDREHMESDFNSMETLRKRLENVRRKSLQRKEQMNRDTGYLKMNNKSRNGHETMSSSTTAPPGAENNGGHEDLVRLTPRRPQTGQSPISSQQRFTSSTLVPSFSLDQGHAPPTSTSIPAARDIGCDGGEKSALLIGGVSEANAESGANGENGENHGSACTPEREMPFYTPRSCPSHSPRRINPAAAADNCSGIREGNPAIGSASMTRKVEDEGRGTKEAAAVDTRSTSEGQHGSAPALTTTSAFSANGAFLHHAPEMQRSQVRGTQGSDGMTTTTTTMQPTSIFATAVRPAQLVMMPVYNDVGTGISPSTPPSRAAASAARIDSSISPRGAGSQDGPGGPRKVAPQAVPRTSTPKLSTHNARKKEAPPTDAPKRGAPHTSSNNPQSSAPSSSSSVPSQQPRLKERAVMSIEVPLQGPDSTSNAPLSSSTSVSEKKGSKRFIDLVSPMSSPISRKKRGRGTSCVQPKKKPNDTSSTEPSVLNLKPGESGSSSQTCQKSSVPQDAHNNEKVGGMYQSAMPPPPPVHEQSATSAAPPRPMFPGVTPAATNIVDNNQQVLSRQKGGKDGKSGKMISLESPTRNGGENASPNSVLMRPVSAPNRSKTAKKSSNGSGGGGNPSLTLAGKSSSSSTLSHAHLSSSTHQPFVGAETTTTRGKMCKSRVSDTPTLFDPLDGQNSADSDSPTLPRFGAFFSLPEKRVSEEGHDDKKNPNPQTTTTSASGGNLQPPLPPSSSIPQQHYASSSSNSHPPALNPPSLGDKNNQLQAASSSTLLQRQSGDFSPLLQPLARAGPQGTPDTSPMLVPIRRPPSSLTNLTKHRPGLASTTAAPSTVRPSHWLYKANEMGDNNNNDNKNFNGPRNERGMVPPSPNRSRSPPMINRCSPLSSMQPQEQQQELHQSQGRNAAPLYGDVQTPAPIQRGFPVSPSPPYTRTPSFLKTQERHQPRLFSTPKPSVGGAAAHGNHGGSIFFPASGGGGGGGVLSPPPMMRSSSSKQISHQEKRMPTSFSSMVQPEKSTKSNMTMRESTDTTFAPGGLWERHKNSTQPSSATPTGRDGKRTASAGGAGREDPTEGSANGGPRETSRPRNKSRLSEGSLTTMRIGELRHLLISANIGCHGGKPDLISRILQCKDKVGEAMRKQDSSNLFGGLKSQGQGQRRGNEQSTQSARQARLKSLASKK